MRALWLLGLSGPLGGCLLLVDPFKDANACQDEDCPGLFACRDARSCHDVCLSGSDCKTGAICVEGECQEGCDEDDCSGHLTCLPDSTECRDQCYDDEHCQQGWWCCDSQAADIEICESDQLGRCLR